MFISWYQLNSTIYLFYPVPKPRLCRGAASSPPRYFILISITSSLRQSNHPGGHLRDVAPYHHTLRTLRETLCTSRSAFLAYSQPARACFSVTRPSRTTVKIENRVPLARHMAKTCHHTVTQELNIKYDFPCRHLINADSRQRLPGCQRHRLLQPRMF